MTQTVMEDAVRDAIPADLATVVEIDQMASMVPGGGTIWDPSLEGTETSVRAFLDAMYRVDASNWGAVEDFIIIERDGTPIAGCAILHTAGKASMCGPVDLSRLGRIASELGWSKTTETTFHKQYSELWSEDPVLFRPHADVIVETVGVLPMYRGKGIGHRLIGAAIDRAVAAGASSVGISVIHGNDRAARLYAHYFEPYMSFHAGYFGGGFPGLTKYRKVLRD